MPHICYGKTVSVLYIWGYPAEIRKKKPYKCISIDTTMCYNVTYMCMSCNTTHASTCHIIHVRTCHVTPRMHAHVISWMYIWHHTCACHVTPCMHVHMTSYMCRSDDNVCTCTCLSCDTYVCSSCKLYLNKLVLVDSCGQGRTAVCNEGNYFSQRQGVWGRALNWGLEDILKHTPNSC